MAHDDASQKLPAQTNNSDAHSFSAGNEYQKPEQYSTDFSHRSNSSATAGPAPQPLTSAPQTGGGNSDPAYDYYGRPINGETPSTLRSIPQPGYYSSGQSSSVPMSSQGNADQSFRYSSSPYATDPLASRPQTTPGNAAPDSARNDATISLILGIIGLLTLTGIILGPMAIYFGNRSKRAGGDATAGIILGWINVGFVALTLFAILAFFGMVAATF